MVTTKKSQHVMKLKSLLFDDELHVRPPVLLVLIAAFVGFAGVIYLAALIDGVLVLPVPGKGLLDHYGFQATYVTTFIVLINCYYAISYFLRVVRNIDSLLKSEIHLSTAKRIVAPHVNSIFLRGRWKWMLVLFMIIGCLGAIVIFKQLDAPQQFWGNDVFNATQYKWSYLAANAALLFAWGVVYPVTGFFAIHITLSSEIIIQRLHSKGILWINFLHDDGCCGMANFGTLNFQIMLLYLWPSIAIVCLSLTHKQTYISLVVGAVVLTLIFICQSVYGILIISKSVSTAKKAVMQELNVIIHRGLADGDVATSALLASTYRAQVVSAKSFPYTDKILVAVKLLRYFPAAITALGYLKKLT